MKEVALTFDRCINPKHSDLTISEIVIDGPIKWNYAYRSCGFDAEKDKAEYNRKILDAIPRFQPIIDALNKSTFGDLSKSRLEDICATTGIQFHSFHRVFSDLEETFSAASKKLRYKHGHLFYEDSEIHCRVVVYFQDDCIQIEFPVAYLGNEYPTVIETSSKQKYAILCSFHDVSDFAVEAYIKIFESALSEKIQDFCCSTFDYASEGFHEGHVTSKFILCLLSVLIDYYEIDVYRLIPEYELGLWSMRNGNHLDLIVVPENYLSTTEISDRIDKHLLSFSSMINDYMRLKGELDDESSPKVEKAFNLLEERMSKLAEKFINSQLLALFPAWYSVSDIPSDS